MFWTFLTKTKSKDREKMGQTESSCVFFVQKGLPHVVRMERLLSP